MRSLFDVNVLLALFDAKHVHHGRVRRWWSAVRPDGWASCPLTQNGFLRVAAQKSYTSPISLSDALDRLRRACAAPLHELWPDDVSLLDTTTVDHGRLLSPAQLTDIYLLALAVSRGGRLVTLDRSIPLKAVRQARPENLVIV